MYWSHRPTKYTVLTDQNRDRLQERANDHTYEQVSDIFPVAGHYGDIVYKVKMLNPFYGNKKEETE